jgi:hypothetical protein
MIDKFLNWINGTYENKNQALSDPTRYSYVGITHCVLPNNFIYGEQKNIFADKIYRQFLIKPIQIDNEIFVQSYYIKKEKYLGFNNLNDFLSGSFIHREKCDIVYKYLDNKFVGDIRNCNCFVEVNGIETYVKTNAVLSENYYKIYDKGFSVKTNKRVWGSVYKHFEFKKIDNGYLWNGG